MVEVSPSISIAVRVFLAQLIRHATDPVVSPYSWFGFTNTLRFRDLLNAHGISVEILPFFLGGARDSVGNPFAPTPKAKEAFASQDSEVTGELLGLKVVRPKIFPISSLFVRILTYFD
jgi:glutathione S-transferase kappa 1